MSVMTAKPDRYSSSGHNWNGELSDGYASCSHCGELENSRDLPRWCGPAGTQIVDLQGEVGMAMRLTRERGTRIAELEAKPCEVCGNDPKLAEIAKSVGLRADVGAARIAELEAILEAGEIYCAACEAPMVAEDMPVRLGRALEKNATLEAENAELRDKLSSLAEAELEYRTSHDLRGRGDINTGGWWDQMRKRGDKARAALEKSPAPVSREVVGGGED